MAALADFAVPIIAQALSCPYSPDQALALTRLQELKLYPEQKHEEFDAVYTPLQWTPSISIEHLKFKISDSTQDVSTIFTSQRYVYRSKLKWYILHPEQIEILQLHQSKYWWRASIFCVDGVCFVGNGNHRVCAALLLGWKQMRVRLLEPIAQQMRTGQWM